MQELLSELVDKALEDISNCHTANDILNIRAQYLGKKSHLNGLFARLKELDPLERPAFGQSINEARARIETAINTQDTLLKQKAWERSSTAVATDLSMPGRKPSKGALHPVTLVQREIEDTFISMGFEVALGFDIEDEFHNFDALNTPADHPSRNLSDTFYMENGQLLRTQTSTVQIRVMETYKPPIRIISPGRCYRNDKPDPSHSPVFSQVEALVVDEHTSMADLQDTLQNFAMLMFGSRVRSRIRPHFFPFTEPSAEIDISCVNCGGTGCRVCKYSGWLEMGGAGMVDPNVLNAVGIDAERYSGFAFGLGIERIAMLKYNIPDLRILFENDIRMLKQFG
ncbi:MAG: phenylalanine--tRNA ligase subunit alpha [Candidatus Cloacimonadaceae bacterium]|nr:phenylalanine--tRNA ligase subunit alpha [Candidatus Cloacimonadaceae bacterium]